MDLFKEENQTTSVRQPRCENSSSNEEFNLVSVVMELTLFLLKSVYITADSVFRTFIPIAEKSVKNEIVLITGAGRGIGKELALQYAALGATVVCLGVSKSKSQETVDEIASMGYPKAYFYECDVRKYALVMETAKKVQREVGDVTILVNNAGVLVPKMVLQQTHDEIKNCIETNLMSHFWTIQAFLPAMLAKNHGHIVANNSVTSFIAIKNGLPYCASKSGIRGLMEALYQEIRINPKCQVKLTNVYPYFVNTEIFKKACIRFPRIMAMQDSQTVAKQIISAQRRNIYELSIPGYFLPLNTLARLLPITVCAMIFDFFYVSIDA